MAKQLSESASDEPKSRQILDARGDDYSKSIDRQFSSSTDFYDVISKVDPAAKFDKFYEDSAEFNELRSKLRGEVLQSLWIALGVSLALTSMAVAVY